MTMMMMMFITGRKLAKYMGEFKPPGLGQGCQAITVTGPLWQAHPPTPNVPRYRPSSCTIGFGYIVAIFIKFPGPTMPTA
jgi:hypothetical protein